MNDHNKGLQGLLEQCLTAVLCPCYGGARGQAEDSVWDPGLGWAGLGCCAMDSFGAKLSSA